MPTSSKLQHLDALQTAAADTLRTGGPPAHALLDLLDNGPEATPCSVGEVLALLAPIDLQTRLQAAAAELDDAVERAHQAQPHAFDRHALCLARRTVGRVTTHLLTDDEWRALARVQEKRCPTSCPRASPCCCTDMSWKQPTRTPGSCSVGPVGRPATPSAAAVGVHTPCLSRRWRSGTSRTTSFPTWTCAWVWCCAARHGASPRAICPAGISRIGRWCCGTGSTVHMSGALQALGETPLTCCRRVHDLLTEALRASGAALLSLDVRTRRSAVSELTVSLVRTAKEPAG